MPDIHPTGKCFDNALDLLCELVGYHGPMTDLYLVHAICRMSATGELYAHAWVEDDQTGVAMFSGFLNGKLQTFATPIEDYHEHLTVVEMTRYTYREAWKQNMEHGHYGPWIEKYLMLCRDYKEAKSARSDRPQGDKHP